MKRRQLSRFCGSAGLRTRSAVALSGLLLPLLIAWCCLGAIARGGEARSYQPPASETEIRIHDSLHSATPENFDFVEQPLSEVIEFLEDYYKIQVEFDSKAMEESAATIDTQVTRNLPHISLASALEIILGEHELTYLIQNDVLWITTVAEAETTTELRVYEVRDLLQGKQTSESLAAVIKAMFPQREDVVPFGDLLVIRDTQRVHAEIERLLATMRSALAGTGLASNKPAESSPQEPATAPTTR